MLCTKCKKEIPQNSVFCSFCGEKQSQKTIPEDSLDLLASLFAEEGEDEPKQEAMEQSELEKKNQTSLRYFLPRKRSFPMFLNHIQKWNER